jgi:hypothetical protein
MHPGGGLRFSCEGSRRHEPRPRGRTAMGRTGTFGTLVFVLSLVSGCTITTHVEPIPRDAPQALCIKENAAVWSKEFLPALRERFERRGIATSVYTDDLPDGCRYRAEYDANWSWDVAVYLVYTDIRVYEDENLIGRVTYDARGGGGRLDKFGSTEGKLDELMTQLLEGAAQP